MLVRLGCLFVLVPLVELALLIQVGRWLGVVPTVGLVAATGLLGAWLLRAEGLRTLDRIRSELAGGRVPGQALMDGAALLVAGAFLLTPGVLTDVWGFALLFRPTRRMLQAWAQRRARLEMERGTLRVSSLRAEAEEDEDDSPPPRPGEIVQ